MNPLTSKIIPKKEIATAIFLGLLLAAWMHSPLIGALGEVLPGESGSDVYRAHWSAWLVAAELPGWPFSSNLVNFPTGISVLPFPTVSLVVLSPFVWLFGVDVSIALLVIFYTVFAFCGTWFLARVLGADTGGACIAGALFASQPILGGALLDGTIELLAAGWLPLFLGSMVLTTRGCRRWGVVSGLIFICLCLESVYLASFASLGCILCLTQVQCKRGVKAAGVAGLTVVLGIAIISLLFSDVIQNASSVLQSSGDNMEALRSGNATSWPILKQLAFYPGSRGWQVGDIVAPPLVHWIVFAIGAIAAIWHRGWIVAFGAVCLLIAVDSQLVAFWSDNPIGEVVRFPRRAMIGFGVALSVAAGLAWSYLGSLNLLSRLRQPFTLSGAVFAAYLAWWGAHAGGYTSAYPLTEIPQTPSFASVIADDPEEVAVLLLPFELPMEQTSREQLRAEMSVFGSLSSEIASSDHLFLQTRMDSAGWYTPGLVTLFERENSNSFVKNLNDLARGSMGMSLPASAFSPPTAYTADVQHLMGEGLKYVAIDRARYAETELVQVERVLSHFSVDRQEFDDGTGIILFTMYQERPESSDAPTSHGVDGSGGGYAGIVTNVRQYIGRIHVVVQSGERTVTCPVRPENGVFACGGISQVDDVTITIDRAVFTVSRQPSSNGEDLTILEMVPTLTPISTVPTGESQ
jgi:hypothetical protein